MNISKLMPTVQVRLTNLEIQHFLTGNSIPRDVVEGYIWFAFQNPAGNLVTLYADEVEIAVRMAENAGCPDLASKLRGAK